MLWYKGWLETRFRLLFALGFVAFVIFLATRSGNSACRQPSVSRATDTFFNFSWTQYYPYMFNRANSRSHFVHLPYLILHVARCTRSFHHETSRLTHAARHMPRFPSSLTSSRARKILAA